VISLSLIAFLIMKKEAQVPCKKEMLPARTCNQLCQLCVFSEFGLCLSRRSLCMDLHCSLSILIMYPVSAHGLQ
jgi:hypothetical protein